MQKKNKVMLAAAIGMVAIVVASTAVRCSLAATAKEEQPQKGEATAVEQEAPVPGAASLPTEEEVDSLAEQIIAELRACAWQAPGDPSKTLAFRGGSFVETDGTGAHVAAFEVKDAGESGGQRHLDIELMREGDPCPTPTTIILEEDKGEATVTCDGFAVERRYVAGEASSEPVAVEGLSEPYTSLIDGKAGELASTVTEWCRGHAPTATKASFDGEVYLDVKGGRVSATFHLDDAAGSIVTCIYESGAFSVLG